MILTHGANSIVRGGGGGGNYVNIGGRDYPYVKIGNQLWMAENLDYAWEELLVGVDHSSSEPRASYFNNDETTYGAGGLKYGLLYNWSAEKNLTANQSKLLPSGWHIPSYSECATLITKCGTPQQAYARLTADHGWDDNGEWDGVSPHGFNMPMSGQYADGKYGWCDPPTSSMYAGGVLRTRDANYDNPNYPRPYVFKILRSVSEVLLNTAGYNLSMQFSIRLVKDVQ